MSQARKNAMTIAQKMEAISAFEEKRLTVKELQSKYRCGKTQIYDLIKNKEQLKKNWLHSAMSDKCVRLNRSTDFDQVNTLVYQWLTTVRSKNLPVSGPMIQASAVKIAEALGLHEFKASNGWLDRFRQRHAVMYRQISGESNDVDPAIVNNWPSKLIEIIEGYSARDIANADETALFFRAIPNKTMALKGDRCVGGKQSKERLTILECAFADGHFEKPLVIGKSRKPRCFKSVKIDELPVTWRANKKAWMTAAIMEEWLLEFNKRMHKQKRNILLFLDNASSHPHLELSNITLAFFPPNTTSILQPMDQGVIRCIKVHYRKQLLRELLANMDTAPNVSALSSKVTLLLYFV